MAAQDEKQGTNRPAGLTQHQARVFLLVNQLAGGLAKEKSPPPGLRGFYQQQQITINGRFLCQCGLMGVNLAKADRNVEQRSQAGSINPLLSYRRIGRQCSQPVKVLLGWIFHLLHLLVG